jgi:hypothetical protein
MSDPYDDYEARKISIDHAYDAGYIDDTQYLRECDRAREDATYEYYR